MASHGQETRQQNDIMTSTAQTKKHTAVLDRMSESAQHGQGYDITTQFFQQTGEQVMNVAQGAANAVKNMTLGINSDNNNNTANNPNSGSNLTNTTNHPINTTSHNMNNPVNHPSNPNNLTSTNNPSNDDPSNNRS